MKTLNFKTVCIAVAALFFLSVNTQAQDKMSKMKKDTTKMSKMEHKKMDKKMGKASKMKKDTTKM